jgi:hypothetical protein
MSEAEPTLVAGIERNDEFVVEGRLITSVGGTIGVGTHERRVVDFGHLSSPAA